MCLQFLAENKSKKLKFRPGLKKYKFEKKNIMVYLSSIGFNLCWIVVELNRHYLNFKFLPPLKVYHSELETQSLGKDVIVFGISKSTGLS